MRRDVNIRYCILIVVVVVLKVEVFADGPVAKLIEKNFATAIPINLIPGLLGIAHVDAPRFKLRFCAHKLLIRNPSILVLVDSLESDPVLIVLSEELEQDAKLTPAYIIICI